MIATGIWQLASVERLTLGVGDGWFDTDTSELPSLYKASKGKGAAFFPAMDEVFFAPEERVRHVAEATGLTLTIDAKGGFTLAGSWTPTRLPVAEFEYSWDDPPTPEALDVARDPFVNGFPPANGRPARDGLGTARVVPEERGLRGEEGIVRVRRDDETLWLLAWNTETVTLHLLDADLSWNHGESTPFVAHWKAVFRREST